MILLPLRGYALGNDVLGLIIEKVTGMTYEKYIEENVLNPMKLNNTYLYKNETVAEHMAQGITL